MKKVINLRNQNSGSIEVICGGMFSGKTEELIRRLRRAEIAKLSVVIFKPQLDSRFKKEHIVSHNRREMKSILIEDPKQICRDISDKKYGSGGEVRADFKEPYSDPEYAVFLLKQSLAKT